MITAFIQFTSHWDKLVTDPFVLALNVTITQNLSFNSNKMQKAPILLATNTCVYVCITTQICGVSSVTSLAL